MMKRLLLPLLFLGTLFHSGCLTYHTSWKKPEPRKDDHIVGRWQGTWISEHNGHNGKLRAVSTHKEGNVYRFQFGATFMLLLTASYDVNFTILPEDNFDALSGEAELPGYMGGLYTYEGKIENGKFTANYKSKLDHGTFEMTKID
jgi:hypothetical protein